MPVPSVMTTASLIPFGAARDKFAESRRIGVVLHIHLAAEELLHVRPQVPVVVPEVGVIPYKPGGEVHAARRTDAHIADLRKSDVILFCHRMAKVRQRFFQIHGRPRQAVAQVIFPMIS